MYNQNCLNSHIHIRYKCLTSSLSTNESQFVLVQGKQPISVVRSQIKQFDSLCQKLTVLISQFYVISFVASVCDANFITTCVVSLLSSAWFTLIFIFITFYWTNSEWGLGQLLDCTAGTNDYFKFYYQREVKFPYLCLW